MLKKTKRMAALGLLLIVGTATAAVVTRVLPGGSMTTPGGDVLPAIEVTSTVMDEGGSPWTTDVRVVVSWNDGAVNTSTKVCTPDAGGHITCELYANTVPLQTSFDVSIWGDADSERTNQSAVFLDAEEGRAAFHANQGVIAEYPSGDLSLIVPTSTLALPPQVGTIAFTAPLQEDSTLSLEGASWSPQDPLLFSSDTDMVAAGTLAASLYSWSFENGWFYAIRNGGETSTRFTSGLIRRGSTASLPGDFSGSVDGVVDLSIYPGASTVLLAAPKESLVDPAGNIDAAYAFLLGAVDGVRSSVVEPGGSFGPLTAPAGSYYLEAWGENAQGDPLRLYSSQVTIQAGTQTLNIN